MSYSNEHDTKKLLRECDAGIKMGIASLEEMESKAEEPRLEQLIKDSRQEHIKLRSDAEKQLCRIKDKGKSPNPMAKAMSAAKTELTMLTGTDKDAARLITEGCSKGIKSLNKYLDRYHYADPKSKQLTCEVIAAEQRLINELEAYDKQ